MRKKEYIVESLRRNENRICVSDDVFEVLKSSNFAHDYIFQLTQCRLREIGNKEFERMIGNDSKRSI